MNARTIALSAVTAVLAGCAAHGSGPTNVLPQDAARLAPAVASTRGQIISVKRVTLVTKKEMEAGVINGVVTRLVGKPLCDVVLYAVRYKTIGVKGEATDASAAFMVPDKGCGAGPFPLIGYAHGTNIAKNQLITDPSTSNRSLDGARSKSDHDRRHLRCASVCRCRNRLSWPRRVDLSVPSLPARRFGSHRRHRRIARHSQRSEETQRTLTVGNRRLSLRAFARRPSRGRYAARDRIGRVQGRVFRSRRRRVERSVRTRRNLRGRGSPSIAGRTTAGCLHVDGLPKNLRQPLQRCVGRFPESVRSRY